MPSRRRNPTNEDKKMVNVDGHPPKENENQQDQDMVNIGDTDFKYECCDDYENDDSIKCSIEKCQNWVHRECLENVWLLDKDLINNLFDSGDSVFLCKGCQSKYNFKANNESGESEESEENNNTKKKISKTNPKKKRTKKKKKNIIKKKRNYDDENDENDKQDDSNDTETPISIENWNLKNEFNKEFKPVGCCVVSIINIHRIKTLAQFEEECVDFIAAENGVCLNHVKLFYRPKGKKSITPAEIKPLLFKHIDLINDYIGYKIMNDDDHTCDLGHATVSGCGLFSVEHSKKDEISIPNASSKTLCKQAGTSYKELLKQNPEGKKFDDILSEMEHMHKDTAVSQCLPAMQCWAGRVYRGECSDKECPQDILKRFVYASGEANIFENLKNRNKNSNNNNNNSSMEMLNLMMMQQMMQQQQQFQMSLLGKRNMYSMDDSDFPSSKRFKSDNINGEKEIILSQEEFLKLQAQLNTLAKALADKDKGPDNFQM